MPAPRLDRCAAIYPGSTMLVVHAQLMARPLRKSGVPVIVLKGADQGAELKLRAG